MLKLVGAIVVALLIVGPLLAQAGLLDHAGLLKEFVDLEVQTFADLVAWVRGLGGHRS